ncbi:MAG: YbaK/EbsC family protein, partial [Actinomycetota bacterium]
MSELPKAARRLIDAVGIDEKEIMVFPEGTKTAEDAANAIGCPVSAIVKTLVFKVDEEPVVALVPGDK